MQVVRLRFTLPPKLMKRVVPGLRLRSACAFDEVGASPASPPVAAAKVSRICSASRALRIYCRCSAIAALKSEAWDRSLQR